MHQLVSHCLDLEQLRIGYSMSQEKRIRWRKLFDFLRFSILKKMLELLNQRPGSGLNPSVEAIIRGIPSQ